MFQASFAQDSQLFENTWYLRSVQLDDLAPICIVSEIDPQLAPFLIISEDFNFNGEGACNIFEGTYSYKLPNYLTATYFSETLFDCDMPIQKLFEMAYFAYISNEFWYEISQDGENHILTLGNPLGGIAVFRSDPLSIEAICKNELTLYPNPTKNELFLNSKYTTSNLKVKIFNIEGKPLASQNLEFDNQTSMDLSNLSSGMYFLNIESENGKIQAKKFIKE